MAHDFDATFAALRKVLAEETAGMAVTADGPTGFLVTGGFSPRWKRDLFFGGVRLGKAYVSYHLMPLYMESRLLAAVSPELAKRMQGKACFNFRTVTDAQLADLRALTRTCRDACRAGAMETARGTCEPRPRKKAAAKKAAARKTTAKAARRTAPDRAKKA